MEAADQLQEMLENEAPSRSDAIVWLQGDQYDRGKKVFELYQEKFAPRIIITGNDELIGQGKRFEESNISLNAMRSWLLARGVAPPDITVDADPLNTREQAEHVIQLAKKNDWRQLILVGSIYYQMRAFLTFLKYAKESDWTGRILNQMAKIKWDDVPSGRQQTARTYFLVDKKKIEQYRAHVAPVAEGIAYLKSRRSI
ncbi:MAG: YdcF family protein [Candidatus Magasanikbacteria bacterium]|nr:YdcF family protein [Candidatus Magasanikbacteria bacterium]